MAAELAQGFKVLEFRSDCSIFPETKPRGRILPTQFITTWVSLGGVSSSLMVNALKVDCDLCFRNVPSERELSKSFEVFSRNACDDSKKGAAICDVTSRGAGYVKT
jgi:hypothetical protein